MRFLLLAGLCGLVQPAIAQQDPLPPADSTTYEVEALDQAPRIRNTGAVRRALEQNYPATLRDGGFGGSVMVSLIIDFDGTPAGIHVTRSSGHREFDQAAIRVAQTLRFSPGRVGGRPVRTRITVPISFVPATSAYSAPSGASRRSRGAR